MAFHAGDQGCEILELRIDLERFSLKCLDSFSHDRRLAPNDGFDERIRNWRYLAGGDDSDTYIHDQQAFGSGIEPERARGPRDADQQYLPADAQEE